MKTLKRNLPALQVKRPPSLANAANARRRPAASIRTRQRMRVWLKQDARCAACGCVLSITEGELDHVVPLVDGGELIDNNTQFLCKPCHADKTAAEATARSQRGVSDGRPDV